MPRYTSGRNIRGLLPSATHCGSANPVCSVVAKNAECRSSIFIYAFFLIQCVGLQPGQCTCEPMRLRAPATMSAPAGSLATTSITCSGIVAPSWWKNSRVRYGEPHLRSAAHRRRPDISSWMSQLSGVAPMRTTSAHVHKNLLHHIADIFVTDTYGA